MISFVTIFCLAFISSTSAETCADKGIEVLPKIDVDALQGTWYGIKGYVSNVEAYDCFRSVYTNYNDSYITIDVTAKLKVVGTTITHSGYVTKEEDAEWTGEMDVHIYPLGFGPRSMIAVDYEEFFIVYSCYDVALVGPYEVLHFFARNRQPSDEVYAKANAVFDKYNLDGPFYAYDQSDEYCDYYSNE